MKDESKLNRSQMLERLKSISPTVMNPTMTFDMGLECTIAAKDGVIYPNPGMFLFCEGDWPIRKLSPSDADFTRERDIYSLINSGKNVYLFTDVSKLETAFLDMFSLDAFWEEMDDSDLLDWLEAISDEGKSIVEMTAAME